MKKEKKIKLVQYGDVNKVARELMCSDTSVRAALTNRSNSEFSQRIRAFVKNNRDLYPYVEY